ncbi:MAG TPA: 3-oxoacyl-ACP reductase, partial [Gammaproteobacteria bacterium]|nr:3-oxoacyl-ACP reductase [Gammaproteobacteria bacterium]
GQCIFITGGATGIGAALVKAFAQQGANVAFVDIDADSAKQLINELESEQGPKLWYQAIDVTNVQALQQAILDADAQLGSVSVLVNNAANDMRHAPADVTAQSWRDCMAINLDAAFFAAQAAAGLMTQRNSGSIINFSSINALLGPSNMPGYVTAKAGIIGLTKALARDYGPNGVRVNAILPGWVATERQLQTWLTPDEESRWMEQVALQERLLPEDVANLALFLAATESKMITGQSFTVDAGRT